MKACQPVLAAGAPAVGTQPLGLRQAVHGSEGGQAAAVNDRAFGHHGLQMGQVTAALRVGHRHLQRLPGLQEHHPRRGRLAGRQLRRGGGQRLRPQHRLALLGLRLLGPHQAGRRPAVRGALLAQQRRQRLAAMAAMGGGCARRRHGRRVAHAFQHRPKWAHQGPVLKSAGPSRRLDPARAQPLPRTWVRVFKARPRRPSSRSRRRWPARG